MTVTVYTKKGCSTCTQARRWLQQKGVTFTERELFEAPLTAAEIQDLLGDRPASELLSTKSPRFKALGLAGKALTDPERIQWMAQEPYLIRRPTFQIGRELVIGLDESRLEAVIPSPRS
jgi:Spx/MgsR family transcriptional regulator